LMPALQVVSNMLGSLGSTHVTAGNQALEFFVSHRDTIALLLKANSDPTSLMALREVRLIVHICMMLLPRIPKSELVSIPRVSDEFVPDCVAGVLHHWLWLHPRCNP
jgi:hypothetical protein